MKLEEYKKDSYEFSKSTSDLVRQFAFAGIAIIWIFKLDNAKIHLIPQELLVPLFLFIITLAFDLFQYFIPSIIWTMFYKHHESKGRGGDFELKASKWLSRPGWICYYCKLITLIVGYFFVMKFIVSKL